MAPSCWSGSSLLALAAPAPAHDQRVGALVLLARAIAERRHAPWRDRMTSSRGRALAAAMRVVDGVHRRTPRLWAHAHVALAARLAHLHVLVVGVPERADGRAAGGAYHPHLARRQAQRGHVAVLGHELDRRTRRARHLPAAAGLELHVVHDRPDGHARELEAVADGDVGTRARGHGHAYSQALGREDVALLAVAVVQQGDVRGAVGVVLDRSHLRLDAVLAPLEVDLSVGALGAAAAMASRLAPVRVAPAALGEPFDELLLGLALGDLGEVGKGGRASAGTGGLGLADGHRYKLLGLDGREALEDRNRLACLHLHDGLLPRPPVAARGATPLGLGLDRDRPDRHHVDAEGGLDGLTDLGLVGFGVHSEGVAVGRREHVALLRDHRADDHLRVVHQELPAHTRAVREARASFESSSEAAPTRSATPTSSAFLTATSARLRNESAAARSSETSATSVGRG